MADVPPPDVTQSRDLSHDLDATQAPSPNPGTGDSSLQMRTWGNFQLLQLLGRGGFGEVYRAWDPMLEREVALKLLIPRGREPEQEFEAIVAEARAAAKVKHPNIVPVFGVDRRDGRVGFWSEFVRGQTLSQYIAAEGPMTAHDAARTGVKLCEALTAVHAAGLLHRDIKASNAMRDEAGHVLLMDFGLSQNLLAASGRSGTPVYMAPEVAAGQPASVQSDLYAMGVLLRFLSTGEVTPVAGSAKKRGADARLAELVRRATDPDPHKRPASAAQMAIELAALPVGKAAQETTSGETRKPWTLRRILILLAIAAFVFGPGLWRKLRESGISTNLPASQDYLAANDALLRYDIPGNTDKAIGLYQSVLRREPENALAEAGLARADWRKYSDTSDEKFADAASQASAKAMTMNPNLAAVEMTAGAIHIDQGKSDVGMQELQEALKLDPHDADAHAAMARAYIQRGRLDDAQKEFEAAMDFDPDNWRWPYLLGAMQIDAGHFKDAEQNLKAALEKTPQNARVLYNLGLVYKTEDRLNDAKDAFEKSIQLDPRADSIMALGNVFFEMHDFENAISTYQRATKISPNQYDTWGNLAEAYAASGQQAQQATEAYRKAAAHAEIQMKHTPDDAYVVSTLGKYYVNLHDDVRALPLLRRAVALAPKDPDVAYQVAESYEELGMRHEAIEFLGKALQLGYSVANAKADPALKALRGDPNAPSEIRDSSSTQKNGGHS